MSPPHRLTNVTLAELIPEKCPTRAIFTLSCDRQSVLFHLKKARSTSGFAHAKLASGTSSKRRFAKVNEGLSLMQTRMGQRREEEAGGISFPPGAVEG